MVEGVGHDHRKMGQAAARRLYDGQKCTTKMSIWPRSALLHSAYYIGVRAKNAGAGFLQRNARTVSRVNG